ncbi:MAG: RNA-binding protein [Candidatus Aenigmarchaeota archaeon]|nr:RNA-binding protein [Candidatus Aenigmarchaeota archaeon]
MADSKEVKKTEAKEIKSVAKEDKPAEMETPKEVVGDPKALKNDKDVVLPGDKIIDSMDYLPGKNTFREGNSIISKRIGLVYFKGRVIEVIPLSGVYVPSVGDMIIGEVKEVQHSGWIIDINSPYEAFLPLSGVREFVDPGKMDMSKIYGTGDIIYGKISLVSPANSIHVTMQDQKARKFDGGRVVRINSVKVPRLIGKMGSMINLIKDKTGCRISVGQNGIVWLQGENEVLAVEVIKTIEDKSHSEGLTNYIEKLLEKKE